jgi:hypothetical protein
MDEKQRNWIRKCDECGNLQQDNPPPKDREPSDAWLNRKCLKCKSEALEWGSWERTKEEEEEWDRLEEEQ